MVRGRLRNFVNVALLSVESTMLRVAVALGCMLAASPAMVRPAMAQDMGPEEARAFVVGKLFAYTCYDGTDGVGRIFTDGSVVGTIRPGGRGPLRFASLPAGTIRVEGQAMCAHLSGMLITPCFRVTKLDRRSFRGTISGLAFAYCDFVQRNSRPQLTNAPGEMPRPPVAEQVSVK
jgi:hypothetical protein